MLEPHFNTIEFYGQGEIRSDPIGRLRRYAVKAIKALDVLNLRGLLSDDVKSIVGEDLYGGQQIKPLRELRGPPRTWLVVCS